MKHLIVTPNENTDIEFLLNEISKIKGVKMVEEEKSFALQGYKLTDNDILNIVKEGESDQYNDAESVLKRLEVKFKI